MDTELYLRSSSVSEVEIGDTQILFDIEASQVCDLNATGRAIWATLTEPKAVPDIADLICRKYAVSRETCESEVMSFLGSLRQSGFVQVVTKNEAATS